MFALHGWVCIAPNSQLTIFNACVSFEFGIKMSCDRFCRNAELKTKKDFERKVVSDLYAKKSGLNVSACCVCAQTKAT